ncbi:MAG: hypothetical protein GC159_22560 [Phycisphaera sp.]|nr:hypothetical protein [Phycisphaera sp.]
MPADAEQAPPTDPSGAGPKKFPCGQCGAKLEYTVGQDTLSCPYCGHETRIPQSSDEIVEIDFQAMLAELADQQDVEEFTSFHCEGCGANVEKPENVTSMECPFCGSNVVSTERSTKLIKPKSLLPFKITRDEGRRSFRDWITSLWFAPNKLKSYARLDDRLNGMYVPYWTYDSATVSYYTGQRGINRTEWYTDSQGNRQSRTVTDWYPASGTVWRDFDDVLVVASRSLPRKYADELEPWDLDNLVPYADDYLAGFRAESYQVELAEGFGMAREKMAKVIEGDVRRDIGGDQQRITSVNTQHSSVTFKHILLPVWICAYRYNDKVYRFLVNARTGEVQGERPWSWVKITLAVLAGLAVVGTVIYFIAQGQH